MGMQAFPPLDLKP